MMLRSIRTWRPKKLFLGSARGKRRLFGPCRRHLRSTPDSRKLSGNFRFSPDFVCLTSGSGPSGRCSRSSGFDPKPKLVTLCVKLIKIGARAVRHGRYITFQMAAVAVSRGMFGQILARIARLRAPPVLA